MPRDLIEAAVRGKSDVMEVEIISIAVLGEVQIRKDDIPDVAGQFLNSALGIGPEAIEGHPEDLGAADAGRILGDEPAALGYLVESPYVWIADVGHDPDADIREKHRLLRALNAAHDLRAAREPKRSGLIR